MKPRTSSMRKFGLFIIPLAALVVYMVRSAGPAYATFPGTNGQITYGRFNPDIGDFQIFVANRMSSN